MGGADQRLEGVLDAEERVPGQITLAIVRLSSERIGATASVGLTISPHSEAHCRIAENRVTACRGAE